jgi:hypothetical protein
MLLRVKVAECGVTTQIVATPAQPGPANPLLELSNVPGRDLVQVHIGNYPTNTIGCLLVGLDANANQCAVLKSADAMALLMKEFTVFGNDWTSTIAITGVA